MYIQLGHIRICDIIINKVTNDSQLSCKISCNDTYNEAKGHLVFTIEETEQIKKAMKG